MSLVGFSAKNHPQQAKRDDIDDRGTPPEFFGPLHAEHTFTIDAAATEANALLPRFWTREDDALRQSWRGERVWCNPPFSGLDPWVAKAWRAMLEEGCDRVVMLLPANRCEQGFWQRHIEPRRDRSTVQGVSLTVRFLPGRMRFKMPADYVCGRKLKGGNRPPFGCCLLIWRTTAPTPTGGG